MAYLCMMKTDKLFVYGSLMGGIQSPIATYLKSNSVFLGAAVVAGYLLDIGKYPGLVYLEQGDSKVFGHLFQLNNPVEMLPRLDYYECVGPEFEKPNQYRRELISCSLDEQSMNCWAYLYNLSREGLPVIASGNYLEYFKTNKAYQAFVVTLTDFSRNE